MRVNTLQQLEEVLAVLCSVETNGLIALTQLPQSQRKHYVGHSDFSRSLRRYAWRLALRANRLNDRANAVVGL